MKRRCLKKTYSCLLASAMVLTMFPTFGISVHAEDNQSLTKEQFSTVEELKNYDTNDNDGVKNPAKVYFGNNNQQWWIAGSQSNNSLTLFSASSMGDGVQFESNYMANKTYDDKWNCTYPDGEPAEVFPNHYGASYIRMIRKTTASIPQRISCILLMETKKIIITLLWERTAQMI